MNKVIQFGERVAGYDIPVLNEREIRASAGILFLATFLSLMMIIFKSNFLPIKYVITFFLTDFAIRVFLSPKLSPTLIVGRLIVRNQVPEYVGAQQKKFAWIIGLSYWAAGATLKFVPPLFKHRPHHAGLPRQALLGPKACQVHLGDDIIPRKVLPQPQLHN